MFSAKSKALVALFSLAAAMSMVGCSKDEKSAESPKEPTQAASPAAAPEPAKVAATAPKADPSVPLDQYAEFTSGRQIMFSYLALSKAPVDYEQVASKISHEYARQSDVFKKRELFESLKPGIDDSIEKAKANRHHSMKISYVQLTSYDFNTKSFKIDSMAGSGYTISFGDSFDGYKIELGNSDKFSTLVVENEQLARKIEAQRTSGLFDLKLYFFITGTVPGKTTMTGEITKVQVLGKNNELLGEI